MRGNSGRVEPSPRLRMDCGRGACADILEPGVPRLATPPQRLLRSMSMGRVIAPLTQPGCQQQDNRISVLAPGTEAGAEAGASSSPMESVRSHCPLLAVCADTWWYSDSSLSSGAHAAVVTGGLVKLEDM